MSDFSVYTYIGIYNDSFQGRLHLALENSPSFLELGSELQSRVS